MNKAYRGLMVMASLVTAAYLSGCATIVHGTKQNVTITSAPQNAQVTIINPTKSVVFTGATPVTAQLSRKSEYDVLVKLPGYRETQVHINKNMDTLYLCNIVCGGLIGLVIDATNGAMNKLEPNNINVSLVTVSTNTGEKNLYAIFLAKDSEGQLRKLEVPLIKS
jgi:hypothetical protein